MFGRCCCSLFVGVDYCLVLAVCLSLCVVSCLLYVVFGLLAIVYSLLSIVRCVDCVA